MEHSSCFPRGERQHRGNTLQFMTLRQETGCQDPEGPSRDWLSLLLPSAMVMETSCEPAVQKTTATCMQRDMTTSSAFF